MSQNILNTAILKVLKPLVRIMLRNNIPFGAFSDLARRAYVEVATDDFKVEGRKQSNSRISTITGLSRKEVKRLQDLEEESDDELIQKYNRAARVVYGWVHDSNYQLEADVTKPLAFDGKEISFSSLVKIYSGDVPPRAILDELSRVGVVEIDSNETIRLLSRAYIPKDGVNEKIHYLGTDISGLINTMDRNIYQTEKVPFFQRKVYYDNLPDEVISEIKQMINQEGQKLLEKIDEKMATHDRDANPGSNGTGRNAIGLGVYYFENDSIENDSIGNDSIESTCTEETNKEKDDE